MGRPNLLASSATVVCGGVDQDALRGQAAVDDSFVVRETNDIGDLPHQVDPLVDAELLATLGEKVV